MLTGARQRMRKAPERRRGLCAIPDPLELSRCGPPADAENRVHSIRKRERAHRESRDDPHVEARFKIGPQLRHVAIEGRKAAGRRLAAGSTCIYRATTMRRQ